MSARRSLVRLWRRLRRPTLGRLVCASLLLHALVGTALIIWLQGLPSTTPRESRAPLIVDLPPAAPGPPLVRPEEAPRSRHAAPRGSTAARPAPAPRPPARPSPSIATGPSPVPPETPRPEPPPPP